MTPLVLDFDDTMTISGDDFEAGAGFQIRLFHNSSISNELTDEIVADQNGHFTLVVPASNPAFCGSGTVASFAESRTGIYVPDFSEAIAVARVGIRC